MPKPEELDTVPNPEELETVPNPAELDTVPIPEKLDTVPNPEELDPVLKLAADPDVALPVPNEEDDLKTLDPPALALPKVVAVAPPFEELPNVEDPNLDPKTEC